MAKRRVDSDTLYGTLNLLILKTLTTGPLHGLAIARHLYDISDEALEIGEGALYTALHRMERDGLVAGSWGMSDTQRRVKTYELTRAGREHLRRETARWKSHARAVASVLGLGLDFGR